MNYILIMTEGTTELAFLDVLLEKNILKFLLEYDFDIGNALISELQRQQNNIELT